MPKRVRQKQQEVPAKRIMKEDIRIEKHDGSAFKTLPITLLSGFLGSGKTTLLSHILNSKEHGLKIAIIVNDMAAINVDAGIIVADGQKRGRDAEKMIAMQNGCICCTLRGDFVIELAKMAKAGDYDYVIIESTGISEPQQVAESFTADFSQAMMGMDGSLDQFNEEENKVFREVAEAGGLNQIARLDTTVTVLDGFRFFEEFETIQLLHERFKSEVETAEDERTVSDLMIDQIEFADVIIVNKIDMIDDDVMEQIRGLIKTLNPGAKVLETSLKVSKQSENPYGIQKLDVKQILATNMYSEETSIKSSGWLKSIHEMSFIDNHGRKVMAPKPETLEQGIYDMNDVGESQLLTMQSRYGINSFVYRARRPFNPGRLFELVHDKFVILEPQEQEEDDDGHESNNDDEDVDEEMSEDEEDSEAGNRHGLPTESEVARRSSKSTQDSEDSIGSSTEATSVDSSTDADAQESLDTKYPDLDLPTRLANKKGHPIFRSLLRSKGFIWLSTRPFVSGDWSQAGAMLTVSGGMNWFDAVPEEDWPSDSPDVKEVIKKDFEGEWGDRRQEIVFIGQGINVNALTGLFNACLLDDAEMKQFAKIMRKKKLSNEGKEDSLGNLFDDGWEDWANPLDAHDARDHDHDHGLGGRHHHLR